MAWCRIPTKPDPRINYCCVICEKEFKLQQGQQPPKDRWDRIVCSTCKTDVRIQIENLGIIYKRSHELDENHIRFLSREWRVPERKIKKAVKQY